ncbi:oxidoreductase [Virgisporangium aliadipatigenens]|uniref:Oxidoreductase n=1 Tax=Virgisporangium aliadipatigenens TaxID=741659 RepID=A0A8J4DUP1_9ACTN|nr:2Fe-2S iron-sulfur cluster-binding protein [Virgisporangium aliadipatigenens]GIJ50591.1 oxidoreductase [Virgisporangium aliadipatigenens]
MAHEGISTAEVTVRVNGQSRSADIDTRTSLLDLLRDRFRLTGTKWGCNQGGCGACTVLVDDQRTLSCLMLAVQADGREVTTIEGLGDAAALHRLQEAFIAHDGFQCGYCTAGQICSGVALAGEAAAGVPSVVTQDLRAETVELSVEEIRERMSGNLCRCGAHNGIVAAVSEVYGS